MQNYKGQIIRQLQAKLKIEQCMKPQTTSDECIATVGRRGYLVLRGV